MTSQAAIAVLDVRPADEGALRVTLELACHCVVTRTIEPDRLLVTDDGARRAIGKYPCPLDHPARRP